MWMPKYWMRIHFLLLMTLLCSLKLSYAQEKASRKPSLIQGIWEGIMNSDSTEHLYKIINGNRSLGISFTNASQVSDFYLNESIEGFQNYKRDEVDSINVKWLSKEGKYYTSIINEKKINKNGWVDIEYCIVPDYFECDGELMSINGGHLSEFDKINELPFNTISILYKRGKLDRRDYINDYLKLETRQVKPLKCKVYANPNEQSKTQLKRDDVVIVIEETSKWAKVKYSEEEFGWIKKDDLK
jgi:hypothetical protein